ncbi:MAG: hypothetical protein CSB46_10885 [Micrococcales bacterium]|nr:MAG: hypothetical protein CSB46_10885 [Micrococcales bacterium]
MAAGGAVCRDCRPPGAAAPHPEAMPLLAALLSGDWARAETFDDAARRSAGGLVNAYVQWHIERGVRSLRHVVREEAAPDVERVLR